MTIPKGKNQIHTLLRNEHVLHAQLTRQLRNLNPQSKQAQDRREHLHDTETVIRYLEQLLD
jgi:hypothetical protein